MNKNLIFFPVFACVICLFLFPVSSMPGKGKETLAARNSKELNLNIKPDLNFGKFPLYFIANKGQVDKKAKFYARASHYNLWLTKEGVVFDSTRRRGNPKSETRNQKQIQNSNFQNSKQRQGRLTTPELTNLPTHQLTNSPTLYERDVSRLLFIGADKNPEIIPLEKAKLKVNYFIGNDKSKWHCGVPTSMAILYKNLYKNIDLKVYGIEKQIEYDWIVKPGGNPADIKFVYKNVKSTRIDDNGDLIIETEFGELLHKKPVSYQENKVQIGGESCVGAQRAVPKKKRIPVDVEFKKTGKNSYGFSVEDYDRSRELVIDPVVLAYSTFLGGGGSELGLGLAADNSGNFYVTGYTSSADFPLLNQYQAYGGGDSDVFISRVDTNGSGAASLVYSTYLGGELDDSGHGIAVDGNGHVWVAGSTHSEDFPTFNPYQVYQGNGDIFLCRLNTNRSGAASLIYSTFFGGEYDDDCQDIAVDRNGNVYLTGFTGSMDFPALNAYQGYKKAFCDAFVTRFKTDQSGALNLIYSTFLGGGNYEYSRGIAVDRSRNVYITGYTRSEDFPTLNPFQGCHGGGIFDAFVARINTNRSGAASLIYSTYLGGSDFEYGEDIAPGESGLVYVTGTTPSTDFPTLNPYQGHQGYRDIFVTGIDTNRSGAASLIYSTYLGGDSSDMGKAAAVDHLGNVYVMGFSSSSNFPTLNPLQGFQGIYDIVICKLDTNRGGNSSLLYSTYLGGGGKDEGYNMAVDNRGNIYVTGRTWSGDFPTLNAYQGNHNGWWIDAFVTRLCNLTLPTVTTTAPSSITCNSAVGGGNITSDGNSEVTARGVCWSTSHSPTLLDNYTKNGSGTGEFTSQISGLTTNTTYYVRAYAANSVGTGYGGIFSFKTLLNPTISGWIKSGSSTPVPDVILNFSNSGGTVKTGPDGYYKHTVLSNWSGIVKPAKQGYIFNPASRTYDAVTKSLINQDYTAYYFVLSLHASRETEFAWIIGRQYGKIELGVNNPDNIVVAKYVIYRKEAGGDYSQLLEIPGSQLQGGTYTHYDYYLGRDKTYTYQFKAFDTKGVTLGESNEKTI